MLVRAEPVSEGVPRVSTRPGELLVVATPIGNLADLSPRARQALRDADVILAEDTRRSRQLLAHHGIARPLEALHEHNERARADALVERMRNGARMALVSDAGTPLLSDPGRVLLARVLDAGLRVSPIPGPSALAAALSIAGLPADRFVFEGFLPARAAARRERLDRLRRETRTLVFYEAPHRVQECLEDLCAMFGDARDAVLARELSKLHETVLRAPLAELRDRVTQDPEQRLGEIVLLVAGAAESAVEAEPTLDVDRLLDALLEELPPRRAAAVAARVSGVGRNDLYQRVLARRAVDAALDPHDDGSETA